MSERPIGDVADALLGLLDDHVETGIQPVVATTRDRINEVSDALGAGPGRRESRLRREVRHIGVDLLEQLQTTRRSIVVAISETLGELDELRQDSDRDRPLASVMGLGESSASLDPPAVIEVSTGSGHNIDALTTPPPDAVILVDGDTVYLTDDHGRVEVAEAILWTEKPEQPRNKTAERDVAGRLPGDHAGHIIARVLGGVGDALNLVPMEGREVNLGQYRHLERRWQRAIQRGLPVEVEVHLLYDGDSRRPTRIFVQDEIDGKVSTTEIRNTPRAMRSQ